MKNIIPLILLLTVVSSVGAAGYGTAGAQILNLHSSAKISAMGNAHAGLADDLNAVLYNPAGLTQLYGTELQFSHMLYFLDTRLSSLTFGQKLGRFGFGLDLKFFSAEDTYRSRYGLDAKSFDIRFAQYSFGLGFPLTKRHSAGIAIKIVSENYNLAETKIGKDKKDSTIAFDIGWHFRGFRGDSFGFVIRNLGSGLKVDNVQSDLPLKYVLGGGHKMGRFILTWEAFSSQQIPFAWKCGIQMDIKGFKLRGGFMYITNPDITIGFGLPYKNWSFDYAFFPHQDLGFAHRMTIGVYF